MKIAVYAISYQEAQFAERFCQSATEADYVFVADTGSTDQTVDILKSNGVNVDSVHISPWRFDDARNAGLSLLPNDIDVCVSLDLDEVLTEGWRAEIERVWKSNTTRLTYLYDWSGDGKHAFHYDKIHARKGYRWKHPVHEVITPYGIPEVRAHTDKLLVIHKPDPTKSRGQYLPLLKMSVEEDPHDARNAFYYARELWFYRHYDEAIKQAERYLSLPGATWHHERCYAMRVIGQCYIAKGDTTQAIEWLRKAVNIAPDTREPYCELAYAFYVRQDWRECLEQASHCLTITKREPVYTSDPAVWGARPHDLAAIAAWNLKLYDLSLNHAERALEIEPNNERLRTNLEAIKKNIIEGSDHG